MCGTSLQYGILNFSCRITRNALFPTKCTHNDTSTIRWGSGNSNLTKVNKLLTKLFQGQATDIQIQAEEIIKLKKQINQLYVNHTGLDLKTIEENMERDKFMSPIEAKEFGLIDTVLTRPVKTQESSTTAVESSPEQSKDENAS